MPVMLDHGLAGDAGGSIFGSSSEGSSYQYGASIEKIGKEFLTISATSRSGTEVRPNSTLRRSFKYIRTASPRFDLSLESESDPISNEQSGLS
jgi:hypothetical protein